MKKWYFVIITIVVFFVLASIKKGQKSKKDNIFKRIDSFVSLLFWVLLTAYGIAFIYWLYQVIS